MKYLIYTSDVPAYNTKIVWIAEAKEREEWDANENFTFQFEAANTKKEAYRIAKEYEKKHGYVSIS